jgi:hypothetical protein
MKQEKPKQSSIDIYTRKVARIYNKTFPLWHLSKHFKETSLQHFLIHLDSTVVLNAMRHTCTKIKDKDEAIKYFCGICWKNIHYGCPPNTIHKQPMEQTITVSYEELKTILDSYTSPIHSKAELHSTIVVWLILQYYTKQPITANEIAGIIHSTPQYIEKIASHLLKLGLACKGGPNEEKVQIR